MLGMILRLALRRWSGELGSAARASLFRRGQMHKYRIAFLGGAAAGFVLGTRAGRERYEQMKKLVRSCAENPAVQQAAGAVQAQATGLLTSARGKVTDSLHQQMPRMAETARHRVEDRVPGLRHRDGHGRSEADGDNGVSGQPPSHRDH
jgi:hypothetical protein